MHKYTDNVISADYSVDSKKLFKTTLNKMYNIYIYPHNKLTHMEYPLNP